MKLKLLILSLLFVAIVQAVGVAKSVEELTRLANDESLPEVRQAAGLALKTAFSTSSQSVEVLRQLALSAPSETVRHAAASALGTRLTRAQNDRAQLETLLNSGAFPEVRQAAARRLGDLLLEDKTLSLDELIGRALTPDNALLRGAVVPALRGALEAAPLSLGALLSRAITGQSAELRLAAAQALVQRVQRSALYPLDASALSTLAEGHAVSLEGSVVGANAALRRAAATLFQRQAGGLGVDALEQLAGDTGLAPELRAAAGAVLGEKLLDANVSLDALETLASSATPELRAATEQALVQAIVFALGRREISLSQVAASVGQAASSELERARADAVFVLLRSTLVKPEAQATLEAVVNGQTQTLNGVALDGSLAGFRAAAGDFLVGIYTFFGFIDRFEDPLRSLETIAEDMALTTEFRASAGRALSVVFGAQRARSLRTLEQLNGLLETLGEQAVQGDPNAALTTLKQFKTLLEAERATVVQTAEVGGDFSARQKLNDETNRSASELERALNTGRLLSVRPQISAIERNFQALKPGLERSPEVSTARLRQLAATGASVELRRAAARALASRLLQDPPDLTALRALARSAQTPELRGAAVDALSAAWQANKASLETLYAEALLGASAQSRAAAARALVRSSALRTLSLLQWQALANGQPVTFNTLALDGTHAELQQTAGEALGPLWAGDESLSNDALIALATNPAGSSALQRAAADALQARWIASSLSESELFELTSAHTLLFGPRPGASAALSQALAHALADRFLRDPGAPGSRL